MSQTRSRRAALLARDLVQRVANQVLERHTQHFLSQAQWEVVAAEIGREAAILMDADFDFCKVVTEGDISDPKGVINAPAVLLALHNMPLSGRKEHMRPRLEHLAQHFKNLMTDLRLLEASNGQTQETPG